MWTEVARLDDIAGGGIKSVCLGDDEIALCNVDGEIHAVSRRCGHMNGPLEQGDLEGWILTCAFHNVQFDVRSGTALNYPIERDPGEEMTPSATLTRTLALFDRLMWKIRVHDLKIWPVRITDGAIQVDV